MKFDGESNGYSLETPNPYFNPQIALNWLLIGQKMQFLKYKLEEKLYQHLDVEFDGKSDDYGLEALNPYLDPLNNWP